MKHYVYRITNTKLNKHYYGTRTSKNKTPEEDIGIYYFSSSKDKDFIKDQKENPQDYKYKVIKKFNTRKEALKLEIKLHNKFNVGINESFYNRSKQSSSKFDTTGNNLIGKKISKLKKGVKAPKQSKTKQSKEWKETKGKLMIEKMKKTVTKQIIIDGKETTIAKETALKASKTMINKGIYKTNGIKISKSNLKLESNGLSVAQNRNIITGEYKRNNKTIYNGESMSISKATALKIRDNKKINGTILSKDKHPAALKIKIFDKMHNLIAFSNGNLKETCKKIGISFKAIRKSYIDNEPLYVKNNPKNKDYYKFKGWYAIKQ